MDDIGYLAERAAIFFGYLDTNEILDVIPYRKKAWADLEARVQSGSVAKLRNLNKFIDNVLIGPGSLGVDQRMEIIRLFDERLNEGENTLIKNKLTLFNKIIKDGFIKSNLVINDAVEIEHSPILNLTSEQKAALRRIIVYSMEQRPLAKK